jgi:hypothetical protein
MNLLTEITIWVVSTLAVVALLSGGNIPYFIHTQFQTTLLLSGAILAVFHFGGFAFIDKIIERRKGKK